MLIDTHTHLYFDKYDNDRDFVIKNLKDNGVEKAIVVGTDIESCKKSIDLAEKYEYIYAAVGFHPTDLNGITSDDIGELKSYLNHSKVVAIGEIGMDFYWDNVAKDKQKKFFVKQLELALNEDFPIIIHNREADNAIMEVLREVNSKYKGVFHCYAGNLEMAEELIEMGFYLSFTGNITYKKSDRAEIIKEIPLNKILLETDSPFLTPVPYRGKRNEPKYVEYVARKIAEIKKISYDNVVEQTTESAIKLFGL
ncbi:MAG: hydrolase TatD [Candidatus Delongbacteria bacterium]|nr:MAG: hydrolase TatD [Candidatus Delongbacteria bacterium]